MSEGVIFTSRLSPHHQMSVQLDDYAELLTELGDHPADVLRAAWQEAARVFSPRGLEAYLRGARALKSLGRGTDLVISFIQGAPEIAREIGEDAVDELVQAALAMASKTSGAVIALVCATAPLAAHRLGDIELFRGYLRLLALLLAQAPRGVRPMLDRLETLLTQLTLGGLLRHMALVEEHTFSTKLWGRPLREPWASVDWDDDPQFEFRTGEQLPPDELVAAYEDAVLAARADIDEALAEGGLSFPARFSWPDGSTPTLRRLLLDGIEEYGRHTGHADLLREAVDGRVGEDAPWPPDPNRLWQPA